MKSPFTIVKKSRLHLNAAMPPQPKKVLKHRVRVTVT